MIKASAHMPCIVIAALYGPTVYFFIGHCLSDEGVTTQLRVANSECSKYLTPNY